MNAWLLLSLHIHLQPLIDSHTWTWHYVWERKKKQKNKKRMQNRMAALRVFCGYISEAVCGQRYLSPRVFSDCQLLVIKLKRHSCQTGQKMRPCEAARPPGDTFWPKLQNIWDGDRQTHANHAQAAIQTERCEEFTSSSPSLLQWGLGSPLKRRTLSLRCTQHSFLERKTKLFLKIVSSFLPGELSGVPL